MILVTGATGLNGSAIVRACSRAGLPVRALVRDATKARELAELRGVQVVVGDMLQADTLADALRHVERVLMISSANGRMVETQCTFIDACRAAGVGHVIKFSGAESGVDFDPTRFRFTRMHEEIERYLERSELQWTQLRPSQFMQVYLRQAPVVAATGKLRLPMGSAALSPVDVEDIAQIAVALLSTEGHGGRRYELTGPEALTMNAVAERLTRATGRLVTYENISPEEHRRVLLAAGASVEFADAMDELFAERRRQRGARVELSVHRTFGVIPTTFAEFAMRHAALFGATDVVTGAAS
jgi:uncharacterized protein YbjT (DUF2867 family)